jgi:hypothetical protein
MFRRDNTIFRKYKTKLKTIYSKLDYVYDIPSDVAQFTILGFTRDMYS